MGVVALLVGWSVGWLLEQFQDGEDDVVDVAKPTRLHLLSVMQSTRPIDC